MNISSEHELRLSEDDDNNPNNSSNISSTSNSTNTSTKSKKSRRTTRSYKCILEYESASEALKRIQEPIDDFKYRFRYTRETKEGTKDFYHCEGQIKCPKILYILRHSDSLKASIWLAKNSHCQKETNAGNLPPKSVAHIKKLFAEKFRYSNNEIINSLRRNNCPQLTKTQINNLKQRIKQEKLGKSNCCVHEIKEWCEKNSDIPCDDDQVFCGGFSYAEDENSQILHLNAFVTTKRLISLTKESHKFYEEGID